LGGGALSAFWTPSTGSVILGRGIGAYSPQYQKERNEWRSLPSHAVTGITDSGDVLTSAHIVKPETTVKSNDQSYSVTARGLVPSFQHRTDDRRAGEINYTRTFESIPTGVRITTSLTADGKDRFAELYEMLPIFLREAGAQPKAIPTTIEFQTDGKWTPATEKYSENVSAVRLSRFNGAVTITFDHRCRVKLAPPWADIYQTRSACRNLLIDLLDSADQPAAIKGVRKVSYSIEAMTK
jgi:hypothetical protein